MKFSNNLRKEYLPLFFASIFVGIVVGLIVGLFNKLLKLISGYSVEIYSFVQDNLIFIPLLFIGIILLAFLMHIIQRKNPQVRGGGIPQTIALSKGEIKYKWYQVLWSNIVCSSISFFGGLFNKISRKAEKILSDVSFIILCISGIFTWTLLILQLL